MKRVIDRIVDGILGGLIIAMTGVIFVSVFMRYVLNNPQSWTDEVSRIMIVWLSFVGAYVALREGKHIGFDLITRKLSPRLQIVNDIVGQVLVIVFLAVMVYQGVLFTHRFLFLPMEYTKIPMGLLGYSVLPVSGLLMFAQSIIRLVESLKALGARRVA